MIRTRGGRTWLCESSVRYGTVVNPPRYFEGVNDFQHDEAVALSIGGA